MSSLRKTEYFVSNRHDGNIPNHYQTALSEVKKMRDDFLMDHDNKIEEILDERVDFNAVSVSGYNTYYLTALLSLTYILK